jgi:integrase
VEGSGFRRTTDTGAPGLRVPPFWSSEIEGVKGPGSDASSAYGNLLAWRQETLYVSDEDLVFPRLRAKGIKPPAANMLVADYPRVAAKKAGVVAPPRTFGFHTFRRTLASVLVKMKVDPKLVQEMLRHQNLKTTLRSTRRR